METVLQALDRDQFITKRNLYYQLVSYYSHNYSQVDSDLDLLAFNTNLLRQHLRVYSSSRCLFAGHLILPAFKPSLVGTPQTVTPLPLATTFAGLSSTARTLLILEKESAIYQLHQQLSFAAKQGDQTVKDFQEKTILMAAKGYPDASSRDLVQALLGIVEEIYYLGDSDVYGLDILLTYALPYRQWSSLLPRLHWIQL